MYYVLHILLSQYLIFLQNFFVNSILKFTFDLLIPSITIL